ncbi:MAG: DinB family protein [Ilumatobacteraceae bacterium]
MSGDLEPDTVEPDTKDWTWVLTQVCPECGYDAARVDLARIPALVVAYGSRWQEVLARADVARRPRPGVWSPLEYACHVRDVFGLFDQRLRLMLTEDDPPFANWDQDETAIAERYREADPTTVAGELTTAADGIAASFAAVDGAQWTRTGRRSDGAVFTVDTFARYFLHDPVHHLHDVGPPQLT